MAFGQSTERREICFCCKKEKTGSKIGKINGVGWGALEREGPVQICVNPNCHEGQKNLAEQRQKS